MATLDELVSVLPHDVARRPLVEDAPSGVQYVEEADTNFVAPELSDLRGGVPVEEAALVLISAPAAVGKSMLARAVAHATGGVLWNLGSFQVGSNFLVGTVGRSHGYAETGTVMSAIGSGEFLIVMDALDEATVRAGLANLEAFAEDVASVLNGLSPARPGVVVLARAETAELTQLILQEQNLPIAHYAISYFDRARAEEFIDLKLDQRELHAHRDYREPFEQARNLLFDRVFTVLGTEPDSWDEPEARGFLGYAPVLEALAQYLDHPNYVALVNEIEQSVASEAASEGESIWHFLVGIIDGVLDREKRKLADSLPSDLAQRLDELGLRDDIYSPREQCARLVARVTRQEPPDPGLPAEVRKEYEEAVSQFLSEHPFVGHGTSHFANVVFRDYVFARALVADTEQRSSVRTFVADPAFRPSPLLARFVVQLKPPDREHLDAADFAIVYDSLRAEDAADHASSLSVAEENGTLSAQFISATAEHIDLSLSVQEGQELQIWRRLTNAIIDLDRIPIVLGRNGEAFTIGPAATIWASQVIVRSPEFLVESREAAESGVTVVAESFLAEAPDPQVVQHGPHALRLEVSHALPYPWVQFRSERLPEEEPASDIRPALGELARLVTWFRSEGFGGLGMYVKPLDAAAAKGRVSQDLLDYALERGLITRQEKLYYLHPGEFGLNLPQIRARVASEPIREFLQAFVAARRS